MQWWSCIVVDGTMKYMAMRAITIEKIMDKEVMMQTSR